MLIMAGGGGKQKEMRLSAKTFTFRIKNSISAQRPLFTQCINIDLYIHLESERSYIIDHDSVNRFGNVHLKNHCS